MFGLLYKDFLVLRKNIMINIFVIMIYSIPLFFSWQKVLGNNGSITGIINAESMIYVIMPLWVYTWVFILISLVQGNIFAQDERKVFSSYIISTPMGVKGQVLSKYYLTFALSFGGFVWGMICDVISGFVSGIEGSAMGIYTALFFIQIFMRSLEIPFLIRYGQKRGRTAKVLMMAVIAFGVIVYALFGKIPEFVSFDECMDFILELVRNPEVLSSTMLGIVAIFPYVAILMYYISYKISCKLYRKGVNVYEA